LTLFASIVVRRELREATSERAWVAAMLQAESALARAEAKAGMLPPAAAAAIAEQCVADRFDVAELAEQARAVGNPAEPLVRALRRAVGEQHARYVHWGATSQDVVDTAAMLVAQRALELVLAEVERVAAASARHAREQRETVIAGRTLLQQAVPTTFGLKAAGWLVGVLEARRELRRVREECLAVQLGGAAGTLAALGSRGAEVSRLFASELDLHEPVLPWHTDRVRVARIGSVLALVAGVAGKIAVDVVLLAQTEVAEAAEGAAGGSSTMPQKRNPVGSALALACSRQVAADAALLESLLVQEHERAPGAWQAEWDPLTRALALSGAAAASIADVLEQLVLDPERMRANLVAETLSERAVFEYGLSRDELAAGPLPDVLAARLAPDELERALDPTGYLGSASAFIDRALELYDAEVPS
jgi:3-carboxy-cis,cis-muconate cycloisomerase